MGVAIKSTKSIANTEKICAIKSQCKSFLIELCCQLQQRLPENIVMLEKVSVFTPRITDSEVKRDITSIVSHFKNIVGNVDATLAEWHLVNSKIIADEKESTEDYWSRIDKITTASEDKRYGHISKLVLDLLALPLSNATVERAFSLVSIIKDKLRNRLAIKSCEAVIRIRYNITQVDLFQPSKSMLNHFTSEEVYASEFQEKILMVIENGAKEQSKEDEEEEEGQDFI